MMPGMDGFQAVQAIKNNPRTATIPIMMYTSQEGELYLGQARALGAVGVLPKQIKPADVSKVLYQLHLVPDRRSTEQTTLHARSTLAIEADDASSAPPATARRAHRQHALREQFAELRRALVAGVDTQTDRITAEVRALLLEALPLPSRGRAPLPARRRRGPGSSPAPRWRIALAQHRAVVAHRARCSSSTGRASWRSCRCRPQATTLRRAPPAGTAPAARRRAGAPAARGRHSRSSCRCRTAPMPWAAPARAHPPAAVSPGAAEVAGVVEIKTYRRALLPGGQRGSMATRWRRMRRRSRKCDLVGNPSDDALQPHAAHPAARSPTWSATSAPPRTARSMCRSRWAMPANLGTALSAGLRGTHRRRVEPRRQRQQPHRNPPALNVEPPARTDR